MASTRDTIPDPDGTKVLQVDGKGKTVGGELGGKTFRTVRWSVRAQQKRDVGCPTWLKTVVVSETLTGARLGASLAGKDEVPASSSFSSMDVEAVVVDAAGIQTGRFRAKHSLVRAVKPDTPAGTPPIAEELWFSSEPFDSSNPEISAMENRCHPNPTPEN